MIDALTTSAAGFTKRIEPKPLTIFVHRASECLTDHLPHGDGLICFSLLSELARRGHRMIAFTNRNGVKNCPGNLEIVEQGYKVPANSLGDWELGMRANRLLKKIERTEQIDLVWRMHPYQSSSPIMPYTNGRPLVIGPLFKSWPIESQPANDLGKPRFGFGIRGLLAPLANRAWDRTLKKASLALCATDSLTNEIRPTTNGKVLTLPVIVDPPEALNIYEACVVDGDPSTTNKTLRLIFAANLYRNKNPMIFCETIGKLRDSGVPFSGTIIGDGPERSAMENFCQTHQLTDLIQFKGRLPNDQVYVELAGADALISTSFGEPYGRSIAEAMSVGTVPVCHRSGGPSDFVSDGIDGVLVDKIDASAYADAITTVWKNAGRLKKLSQSAKEKARNWRTEIVVNQLESALFSLVSESARR